MKAQQPLWQWFIWTFACLSTALQWELVQNLQLLKVTSGKTLDFWPWCVVTVRRWTRLCSRWQKNRRITYWIMEIPLAPADVGGATDVGAPLPSIRATSKIKILFPRNRHCFSEYSFMLKHFSPIFFQNPEEKQSVLRLRLFLDYI